MFSSPAFAQAAAPAGGSSDPMVILIGFAPYLAIFAIFYFLLIRPQQQRVKAHRAMVDAVARGDEVVTGGGIIGKAVKVEDSEVEVEVASGVKLRVLKATLADVRKSGGASTTAKA
ncbi:MAG: preprotein translocase subunit YajC [Polymorphobacter sp.]|uniref:preprotein translocase subunit YajC n=1 Tax=Polymorphobacter sp. TaxID=1909290 RepID=UPI003A892242